MYPGVRKSNAWILLAIIAWTARLGSAQSPTDSASVLKLRTYGWKPPEPRGIDSPSIAIDHEDRVVVGFTVRERNGLATRNQPSLSFHIVRFSPDGKADLSLSLPTNAAGRTGIYLSDTDQIVARANDSLQLLQVDEAAPQKAVWQMLAPRAARCTVKQSLTRHTFLLDSEDADPPLTLVNLSPQPELRRCGMAHRYIKSSEDEIQNIPQITDKFAYFHGQDFDSGHFTDFLYRWPLCDYEHRIEMPLRIRGRWIVLNDNIFVDVNSNRGGEELEVTSSEGRVKFRPTMLKHEFGSFWTPIRSSERGDRIAVDMLTVRGGNQALDISGHVTARRIAVYDIEAEKELASIANPKHRYRFEFDLSPDGRRLAILEDDVVRVVDLDGLAKSGLH
jgi:hypothetical protein